jgi:hypothetical protein
VKPWLSRHALALWFAMLSALGALRFWMEWREAHTTPLPGDAWLWLAGAGGCALVAAVLALRASR